MFEKIKNKSITLTIGVLIFCLLIVVFVSAWTGPSGAPPDPNASAPINVSSSGQEKEGQLGIAIPSGESLDGSYGLTVGTASNPLGIKTNDEIFFTDNGQIRSLDNNHRILFRRSENLFEIREYGDIIFSAGSTSGGQTSTMYLDNSGNVGIGTTAPGYKLDVNGDLRVRGNDIYGTGSLRLRGAGGGYVEAKSNSATYGLIVRDNNSSNWGNIDANDGYLAIGYNNSNGPLFVSDNDRVGIGDSTPSYKLDVAGSIRATGTIHGSLGKTGCYWHQVGPCILAPWAQGICNDGYYMAGFAMSNTLGCIGYRIYCCKP